MCSFSELRLGKLGARQQFQSALALARSAWVRSCVVSPPSGPASRVTFSGLGICFRRWSASGARRSLSSSPPVPSRKTSMSAIPATSACSTIVEFQSRAFFALVERAICITWAGIWRSPCRHIFPPCNLLCAPTLVAGRSFLFGVQRITGDHRVHRAANDGGHVCARRRKSARVVRLGGSERGNAPIAIFPAGNSGK